MTLADYVIEHAIRGSCQCGKCADAPAIPNQPNGHTVSVEFFEVAQQGATKEEFLALVRKDHPTLLNGEEHSYIEIGGMVGSQEIGLMTIALGALLGAWHLMSPTAIFGNEMPKEVRMHYAARGLVGMLFRPALPPIGAELTVEGLADAISVTLPDYQREANRKFMRMTHSVLRDDGKWGWPNTGTIWAKTPTGFKREL